MIDLDLIIDTFPQMLRGFGYSLIIATISSTIGIVGGIVISIIQRSDSVVDYFQYTVWVYVNLVRGTPMLIQLLFAYYVFPQWGIFLSPFITACLILGLNSVAYVSQIIRGGMDAIPKGQWDAAKSLGFSEIQTYYLIILPQVIRNVLPSLGNEIITLIKDSSLASVIGVTELTKEGRIIISRTYDTSTVFFVLACFYIFTTGLISFGIYILEKRLRHNAHS